MNRLLVLANDLLLADASASMLAEPIDLGPICLTHRESTFYSFSLGKTHKREKRDEVNLAWASCRI